VGSPGVNLKFASIALSDVPFQWRYGSAGALDPVNVIVIGTSTSAAITAGSPAIRAGVGRSAVRSRSTNTPGPGARTGRPETLTRRAFTVVVAPIVAASTASSQSPSAARSPSE